MSKMHVSLVVRDLAASLRFYTAFFGEAPHKVRSGYANFDLDFPPLKLALTEGLTDGKGSLDHLGIIVGSKAEVEAAKERVIAAGLTAFAEEEVTCCYATQDKIWVTDPDGNSWEVYVLLDDAPEDRFGDRAMQMLPGFRQS